MAVRRKLRDATALQRVVHPSDVLDALLAAGIVPPATSDNPAIDLAVHESGARRLVFTANTAGSPQQGTLHLDGALQLTGLWETGTLTGPGAFTLTLAPHAVQVWEVEPC